MEKERKPLFWIASSREDLRDFPAEVKKSMGLALVQAQEGGKHSIAKPLKGFGGAGVLEIVADHQSNAYPPYILLSLPKRFMFCMPFKRSPDGGLKQPKRISS